jgi:CubicO group peptidase (beta-lactamase class C family)
MSVASRSSFVAASVLLVSSLAAAPVRGQTAPEPTLEQRLQQLCDDVEQRRADLRISGLSLAVVKDDRVVLARGFGLRDRTKKLPADENTLYGIGSTSKAFTSMACAMLADEGKLAFTDRPVKFLPWFKFKDPACDANATLRDLLCHRTGLTRNDVAWIGGEANREEMLRSVADIEPMQPFYGRGQGANGSDRGAWQYNNCMFLCAGECAAAVAGSSWDDLVAARIFQPLGMKRTVTSSKAALADAQLSGRYDWDGKKNDFEPVEWMTIDNMAPAGAICSTVVDMAQWVRFLLNRGTYEGRRLVAETEFDELWKDDDDLVPNYGLGWFIHPGDAEIARTNSDKDKRGPRDDSQSWRDAEGRKHLVIEHGGNVAGYAAEVGLLPDLKLGVVMLSNTSATQLQAGILPLVWNAIGGPWKERRAIVEGTPLPEAKTASWLGSFYDKRFTWKPDRALIRASDHLALVIPPEPGRISATVYTLLWPDAEGRFWIREDPDSYVKFDSTDGGAPRAINLYESGRPEPACLLPKPPPAAAFAPDVDLDAILAKRADALGLATLAGWHTLRMTGTMSYPQAGIKGRYVLSARGADRLRIDFDAGKLGRSTLILSGGKGTLRAHFGGMPVLPPERVATLIFANPFVEGGTWLDHAEDVALDKLAMNWQFGQLPGPCYAISVKPWDADPIVYYVSTDTLRTVAMQGPIAFAGMPTALPFASQSDWRDVKGVQLAFRREIATPDIGRLILQFSEAAVDVEMPDELFDLAPPESKPKAAGS